jgi:hypothetical protein
MTDDRTIEKTPDVVRLAEAVLGTAPTRTELEALVDVLRETGIPEVPDSVVLALNPFEADCSDAPAGCRWIPMANGKGRALVSIEDYKVLRRYNWSAVPTRGGYFRAMAHIPKQDAAKLGLRTGGQTQMYRVVMGLKTGHPLPPGLVVDHINGRPYDNRRCNLRMASVAQNSQSRRLNCNNTTGYKWVTYDTRRGKYYARVIANHQRYFVGLFDDPAEAHAAAWKVAQELHGEFVRRA